MERKKLFKRLAYLIFFIFLANFLANKFHWYFSIWYFDMVMHFLGGFWLSLVFIWLFSYKKVSFEVNFQSIFKILLGVLIIGIFWEIFEFYFINYIAENPFKILDTTSDLFFDLLGGISAIFYFSKRVMFTSKDTIQ